MGSAQIKQLLKDLDALLVVHFYQKGSVAKWAKAALDKMMELS
ncbi:hypothetical protein NHP190012_01270 [Helicobacter sp. NHP19-012]|uniref:Uncharacterized protein n=1 Tax=Helicobacter gastrofelis TaxID=2849642 RepID=A0ABM7SCQ5_9HELI|nr:MULTISPECIES: hypothetical protein [unclassified Helicobacter]BCZ18485.1 hypothetical protein NHP190012_01270 [Helicobacter sp. NHP19-012]GMB95761.1 hypothetical protein NHP22001_03500 [Helicobacter sp. NHP22-001]